MSQEIKLQGGDIALRGGQFHMIEKSEKLEQQTLKILLSDRAFNLFHPEYGTRIYDMVGRYQGVEDVGDAVVRQDVQRALTYYQGIQQRQELSQELDDEEVLLNVLNILVYQPRSDIINVDITTRDRKGQENIVSGSQLLTS